MTGVLVAGAVAGVLAAMPALAGQEPPRWTSTCNPPSDAQREAMEPEDFGRWMSFRQDCALFYNACRRFEFRTINPFLDEGALELGLSSGPIQDLLNDRLRRAGLHVSPDDPSEVARRRWIEGRGGSATDPNWGGLSAMISVVGPAFAVDLEYRKWLFDHRLPDDGGRSVVVWEETVLGTHGRDLEFILRTLVDQVDDFALRYLRVNAPACDDLLVCRPGNTHCNL